MLGINIVVVFDSEFCLVVIMLLVVFCNNIMGDCMFLIDGVVFLYVLGIFFGVLLKNCGVVVL